jgi:hypothetical protein
MTGAGEVTKQDRQCCQPSQGVEFLKSAGHEFLSDTFAGSALDVAA